MLAVTGFGQKWTTYYNDFSVLVDSRVSQHTAKGRCSNQ